VTLDFRKWALEESANNICYQVLVTKIAKTFVELWALNTSVDLQHLCFLLLIKAVYRCEHQQ